MTHRRTTLAHRWIAPVLLLLFVALAVAACGDDDDSGSGGPTKAESTTAYTPVEPEPGTDVPKATVRLGMRPYADNTFYVAGIKEGWFEDVGIEITPEPNGLKTVEDQWVNLLLNREVDINSATCGSLLSSYKTTDQLKCAGFVDTFYGLVMLANPDLGLKSVDDYIQEGASFEDALKQALQPLSGQTVYVPTAAASRPFHEVPFELAGLPLPNYKPMDDPQMLLLAKSGRLQFANPAGAPIASTLLDQGWTPVYDTGQLLEHGPAGVDSPLEALVFNNGWAASADFINENRGTTLRFASVVFRILDELQKDPSLYDVYAPYLNSVAGTDLDGADIERTVDNLHPYVTFEEQTKYFVDKDGTEYYGNSMGALIKALEKDKTIPTGIKPEEIVWAAPMYDELMDYKAKTDTLLGEAEGEDLSSDKQQLLERAREFYQWYDYLDAYRFAKAALE
jgi:ABC-type nitrate/sulfonate/bicarbonate transport system substrate-binding protein